MFQQPSIEKLKGRENYDTWKVAVQAYLEDCELWNCVLGTEIDRKKIAKCKSKIILLVDAVNYVHVQSADTAKEAWDNLERAFSDRGLTRRVGLLRSLITTKLEDCNSIEDYVNRIVTTAFKLTNIGLKVDDEWVGTILLAGLPDQFQPMIMGIESSGVKITADSIKTKLLQDVSVENEHSKCVAMYGHSRGKYQGSKNSNRCHDAGDKKLYGGKKPQDNQNSKGPRCFKCNKYGHISQNCHIKTCKKNTDGKNLCKSELQKSLFAAFSMKTNVNKEWYLDSGASAHLCVDSNILENKRKSPELNITTANNTTMVTDTIGDIELPVKVCGTTSDVHVSNVYHVPQLSVNLLSVSQIVSKGHTVIFNNNGAKVCNSKNEVIATASLVNNLFKLDVSSSFGTAMTAKCNEHILWHRRMAHLNFDSLKKLGNGLVHGVNLSDKVPDIPCEICLVGKSYRLPFQLSNSKTSELLELVHSDLAGPMEVNSLGGSRYILTFLDDFSHKTFVYFLKSKDQVFETFKTFKSLVENQSGKTIKTLRTDGGGEYCSKRFSEECTKAGIVHQTTCSYTPQQNGKAERLNRSLLDRARCLLLESELPKSFWAEAVNTVAYLLNRSPSKAISLTPEELWSGHKPSLSHLKMFGCKAYAHIPAQKRKKLDARSKPCIFIGYGSSTKGYRLYDPKTEDVFLSRDVTFSESEKGSFMLTKDEDQKDCYFYVPPNDQDLAVAEPDLETEPSLETSDSEEPQYDSANSEVEPDGMMEPNPPITYSRPQRERKPPNALKDFVTYYVDGAEPTDPVTVKEAMESPEKELWLKAMNEELSSQMENKSWELVDLPPGKKPLNSKWVFKTKRDAEGNIVRHKARLVVKGCAQRKGIDFDEVYSPVVRYSSLRYLLALAAEKDLDIDQMDAVSAFLQGDLTEEIYMNQPEGSQQEPNKVCRLRKSIYGLKQASRNWNKKLHDCLMRFGLKKSNYDQCVYHMMKNGRILIVAVWVDDLLIFHQDKQLKETLKSRLMNEFKMKDIGEAKFALGFQITRDRKNKKLFISQRSYIEQVLKRFNMDQCKPVLTPMSPNEKLSKEQSPTTKQEVEEMENVPYQEAVGSLLFAAQVSRPDICYAVSCVSRFNQNPGKAHWAAVKRILRYMKGTLDKGLSFDGNKPTDIIGYSDSDWASDGDDRRSTTGYIFIKCNGAISWNTKKQPTVALSTTEAEYMAMSAATQEALWLKGLANEITHSSDPITIFVDNQGAKNLALNGAYQPRTKHIDVRHHFLREKVESKKVKFIYTPTSSMVADSLTKPLDREKLMKCIQEQGVCKLGGC